MKVVFLFTFIFKVVYGMNGSCSDDNEKSCTITNLINELDLRLPKSLQNLSLINVQLTRLPHSLSDLPEIQQVQVHDSILQDFSTNKSIPTIRVLNLSRNKITTLTRNMLQSYPNLQYLNVSHNKISVIEDYAFTGTSSIVSLDLTSNQLRKLSAPLSARPLLDLKILRLDNNQLGELSEDLFDTLFMLKHLSLSGNYLKIVTDKTLRPLYYLEELNLDNNHLHSISLENQKLNKLNLGGNNLSADKILGLSRCRLTDLNLSFNPLSSLQLLNFTNLNYLQTLTMDHMKFLSFISFEGPPNLRVLSLRHNDYPNISNCNFKSLTQLNLLQIDGNQLKNIDLQYLPNSLTYIGLNDNEFSCTYLDGLLKNLRLQGVRLYLTSDSFERSYSRGRKVSNIQGVTCFIDNHEDVLVESCKINEEDFLYAWHTSLATTVCLALAIVYVFILWRYRKELRKIRDNDEGAVEEKQMLTFHDLLSKDQNEF